MHHPYLHCVCFPTSCLAVGKYTHIVPVYTGRHQCLHLIKYLKHATGDLKTSRGHETITVSAG